MRNWLPRRFREFFSRTARVKRDAELDAELQSHIAEAIRERTDRGESAQHARSAARKEFGNLAIVKETTRAMWGPRWLEILAQDLRYAARSLRRNPGFSAAVVLALALGIGVNVTMFSLADLLLLHYPAHVSDPSDLFRVKSVNMKTGEGQVVSDRKTFAELAENSKSIEVAGQAWGTLDFGRGADARQIDVTYVTSNYFHLLGAPLLMGRAFSERECSIDASAPLAIVSHRFWQEHLGGAPDILDAISGSAISAQRSSGLRPKSSTARAQAPQISGFRLATHSTSPLAARLGSKRSGACEKGSPPRQRNRRPLASRCIPNANADGRSGLIRISATDGKRFRTWSDYPFPSRESRSVFC